MENSTHKNTTESITLTDKSHIHDYEVHENHQICKICGKRMLHLDSTEHDNVLIGQRKNGKKYSVRRNRQRYFFPDEWEKFISVVGKREHRFFFMTLLHTGARMMEILHLKHKDIDKTRSTINFNVVKHKRSKKNVHSIGKARNFFVSNNFIKEYNSFIRGKTIKADDYIFLDNKKLPTDYDLLDNLKKKEYYKTKSAGFSNLLKRKLIKAGIEDYYNFSPHNFRKTYGMWMRCLGIEIAELCYRLGHDIDTYFKHYGSSLIFSELEKRKIMKIIGEVNV